MGAIQRRHLGGITGRARVVVYGTEALTEADLPDDLWGFTESRWKGRVAWAPTNSSFQAMVTALRVGWGEERTEQWLRAMLDNDVQNYPKNTPQVAAAAAGEIDVGLVNHYYLYRFIAEEGEDFPARNAHLRAAGPGAIVLVSGVSILETADNRRMRKRCPIPAEQGGPAVLCRFDFEYPLVEEVRPSALLTPLEEIGQPDITLADLGDLGRHAGNAAKSRGAALAAASRLLPLLRASGPVGSLLPAGSVQHLPPTAPAWRTPDGRRRR